MAAFLIAAASVALLGAVSLAADRRLSGHARLPMQWAVDGRATWSAPRRFALSFTPALAAVTLLFAAVRLADRPDRAVWTVALIGLAFLAAHLFHLLRLIRRGEV